MSGKQVALIKQWSSIGNLSCQGILDSNRLKVYSISYDVILKKQQWGELAGWLSLLKEGLAIYLWVVINCIAHHLYCIFFFSYFLYTFSVVLNPLCLSQLVLLFFLNLFLILLKMYMCDRIAMRCLIDCWITSQLFSKGMDKVDSFLVSSVSNVSVAEAQQYPSGCLKHLLLGQSMTKVHRDTEAVTIRCFCQSLSVKLSLA